MKILSTAYTPRRNNLEKVWTIAPGNLFPREQADPGVRIYLGTQLPRHGGHQPRHESLWKIIPEDPLGLKG